MLRDGPERERLRPAGLRDVVWQGEAEAWWGQTVRSGRARSGEVRSGQVRSGQRVHSGTGQATLTLTRAAAVHQVWEPLTEVYPCKPAEMNFTCIVKNPHGRNGNNCYIHFALYSINIAQCCPIAVWLIIRQAFGFSKTD